VDALQDQILKQWNKWFKANPERIKHKPSHSALKTALLRISLDRGKDIEQEASCNSLEIGSYEGTPNEISPVETPLQTPRRKALKKLKKSSKNAQKVKEIEDNRTTEQLLHEAQKEKEHLESTKNLNTSNALFERKCANDVTVSSGDIQQSFKVDMTSVDAKHSILTAATETNQL